MQRTNELRDEEVTGFLQKKDEDQEQGERRQREAAGRRLGEWMKYGRNGEGATEEWSKRAWTCQP